MHEPWMLTASGREFDLVAPTPKMVDFADIAEHLSKLSRFAGATPGQFYSVAEHCVRAAEALYRMGHSLEHCAYALLHDAHEAYIVDRITPERWAEEAIAREQFHDDAIVGAVIQVPKLLRYRIDTAIHAAAGLAYPLSSGDQAIIKQIDLVMLATEKRDLMPASRPWALLNGLDPLPDPIRPVCWEAARALFTIAIERFLPDIARAARSLGAACRAQALRASRRPVAGALRHGRDRRDDGHPEVRRRALGRQFSRAGAICGRIGRVMPKSLELTDAPRRLKVKMRGDFRSGKTQLLIAIERFVASLGMSAVMNADGHNLEVVSTRSARVKLYWKNHGQAPADEDEADE